MPAPGHLVAERLRINLVWLLKLRWAAAFGQLATILGVTALLRIGLPLVPLLSVVAITAASNVALWLWLSRRERGRQLALRVEGGDRLVGAVMAFDVVSLTALLYLTGGTENPFCLFYLVNMALAATVVQSRGVWAIHALALSGFTVLLFVRVPLPELDRSTPRAGEFASATLDLASRGLLVAFAASTLVIVYFIARLSGELRVRDIELGRTQRRKARSEKLEALATLAAGAAHELATPLSTIAIVAKELGRELQKGGASEASLRDAELIRRELDHCRAILDRMAGHAGEAVGEELVSTRPRRLADAALEGLDDVARVTVRSAESEESGRLFVPMVALAQALRGIVKNALDASAPQGEVRITLRDQERCVRLEIADDGPGMSAEILERAGEPFFTTKEPGQGMGLGIFLARAVVERLDGELTLRSRPGRGTVVAVTLPLADSADAQPIA